MRRMFLLGILTLALGPSSAHAERVWGRVYDTLRGKIHVDATVALESSPAHATRTDGAGQYSFEDVKPGPYLVRITLEDGREIVGRVVVYDMPTTIANLDLSKIEEPDEDENY
jgi:hypothetical protein